MALGVGSMIIMVYFYGKHCRVKGMRLSRGGRPQRDMLCLADRASDDMMEVQTKLRYDTVQYGTTPVHRIQKIKINMCIDQESCRMFHVGSEQIRGNECVRRQDRLVCTQ